MLYLPSPLVKRLFAELCKRESFTVSDVEGLFQKPIMSQREKEETYYKCLQLVGDARKKGKIRWCKEDLRFERN